MKAVDSVSISSFPDSVNTAMVPKVEASNKLQCNGESARLKNSVNSPLVGEAPALVYNGSSDNETERSGNVMDLVSSPKKKEVNVNGSLINGDLSDVVSNGHSCLRVNRTVEKDSVNCGVERVETPSKKTVDKLIETSRVNGIINNGYYQGDDESGNEKQSLESLTDVEVEEGKRSSSPPENIPRYSGLHIDSGLESAASSWDRTVAEAKEHAVSRLQEELRRAREELKLKDEEVGRLSRIREEVEAELEELTASLFQEAHNMVRVANERKAAAEKALRESTMQVDVLTAEVAALKTLVLTSTPSMPNPHLHPQIDPKAKDDSSSTGNTLFRKHRRSPSHYNLKYGRENSPPESPVKEPKPANPPTEPVEVRDSIEVDPVIHKEFLTWKQSPTMEQTDPFVARIYREDINCCLSFTNIELAAEVCSAVKSNTIYIEAVNEKSKTHFPKKCALLEAPRQCQYRMRLGDTETWHCISQICRNRIIAVCDFLNYLNYIQRGLVKSSVHDVYWEIVRLRKEMVLARLGLPLTT